ncbi:MAG: hypothetical protein K6F35_05370 [Lachnospiraceae bacterium]|nr:hypothetical protein [Lachnospiraceae bacterium]
MGKQEISAGELLHTTAERVQEIQILLKGSVTATGPACTVKLGYGSLLGLMEVPGEYYRFDYEADEDAVVYSYKYGSTEDLYAIIRANPQISPYLVEAAVGTVGEVYEKTAKACSENIEYYDELLKESEGIEELCIAAGESYVPGDLFDTLPRPEKPDLSEFESRFFASLSKDMYSLGAEFVTGIILYAGKYLGLLTEQIEKASEERIKLNEDTAEFVMRLNELKRLASDADAGKAASKEKFSGSNSIEIKGALDAILSFAEAGPEEAKKFKKLVNDFARMPDKTDQSDEARKTRKDLAECFYSTYEKVFLKSMHVSAPLEIKMFLLFAFVDENLAGKENTATLAYLADTYKPDPAGNVVTIYEWLKLVYDKAVDPSKNEFDLEYPAYLKEQVHNGDIRQSEMRSLLESGEERALFEIRNFFHLANRMTYGRISSFVPVFFGEDHIKSPEESMLKSPTVHQYLDEIRSVDFSCFCRDVMYSNPKIGVNREYVAKEVLPYVILLPNAGQRGAMWQEISGSRRDTPARMMVPMFPSGNAKQFFLILAGEFRWEMCRREQGVHWNDVTVPSLTSEYSDYLQFYRKNHDLSPEVREKIKLQLQSARNSVKGVFVSDYVNYVEFEKSGSLRLNKLARSIIFRYCPFPREIRDTLGTASPAYADIISKFNLKRAQKLHLLDILMQKIEKSGATVPKEISMQVGFLKR